MPKGSVIKHKKRAQQILSFEGMVFHRKIMPTDMDGIISFAGNVFVVIEGKMSGVSLKRGQQMAIEEICNALDAAGCCLGIFFHHDTPPEEEVIVGQCEVKEIYWKGKWWNRESKTVKQEIDSLLTWCKKEGFKI